ncbi:MULTISPECIES: hypothetical protein [Niallia]|nr:hypothetical protein [Niallia circulans]ECD6517376.1 hypothetical protein [Salmonella enterica subsp. enterica serovar Paratyphi A]KAB7665450.1 hypothetical protein F9279_20335 [Bacillus sp. B1-b2]CAI9397108.1 hypothetical protein BACSP_04475 [Bacillus sp. T2.9-1]SLL37111.1 Uncharacterised protein [Mycobacteroides abscessus subsp. abscessus]HEO8422242.1 hypothetical protein [Yersinia enterocolitica]
MLNKLIELISEGNISLGQLSIIFAVILTITAIIGYTFLFWEQRSYEKLLTGKPLPSNRGSVRKMRIYNVKEIKI